MIKGIAIRTVARACEKLYGAEALLAVKAAMPVRLREKADGAVGTQWYPVEIPAAFHAALRDVVGGGTWDASHAVGHEAARIDFTGVYRVFLRTVQYDTVWDRMERAWPAYNSTGYAKWIERDPGHARAVVEGVAGYNEGLWRSVAGRIEGLLVLSGAKGPVATISSPTSTSCKFEAMWLE